MADEDSVGGAAIHRREPYLQSFPGPLLLSIALLALACGCREEAANAPAPTTETPSQRMAVSAEPGGAKDSATAEPAVGGAGPQVADAPRIVLERTEHDFGEIGPGTPQSTQFKFKNEGTAPLKITGVRSCCGVVTRGVKAGQEYAPGASGALAIDYRAGTQPGSMKRNLYIQSDDPLQGVTTLTIKATIVQRVDYAPKSLKLFLKQENAGAKVITLKSLDGRPFSIKGFRATANALTADFDPAAEATQFVLRPKANMEKLERNLRGQISIDLTHPECKNIRILYDVMTEFTVTPQPIMLFNLKAGQPMQREIWILSNYQEDFEIESVTSQQGTAKLVDKKKVDTRYQLKIEITPPPAEGERTVMSDVIEVKIKDGETLSIQCRGFYQGT